MVEFDPLIHPRSVYQGRLVAHLLQESSALIDFNISVLATHTLVVDAGHQVGVPPDDGPLVYQLYGVVPRDQAIPLRVF